MRPDTQTLQKYATNAELQFEKQNNCQIISGNSYRQVIGINECECSKVNTIVLLLFVREFCILFQIVS
jgi:hypothetical protein